MVNDGGGTFTLDPIRAPNALLRNPPEYWRHVGNDLVDLDNDGDLDLALGQIRDLEPTHDPTRRTARETAPGTRRRRRRRRDDRREGTASLRSTLATSTAAR